MLSRSSFGTGCLLLVVLTLFGSTFGNPTNDTNTKLLLSSFAQAKVLSMGVLDQKLLIITKDSPPVVYEVPMANYANNQINLYGVVPVDLMDKWPVLNGNDNFTKGVLNGRNAQSFSIGMDKATLISAFDSDIVEDHALVQTVAFTFKPPSTTYREFKIYDRDFYLDKAHLISSDEPNVFFNLKTIDHGRIYRLNKFAFNNSNGFQPEWKYNMCKSPAVNNSIPEVVFKPWDSQCSSIDWKIENDGFVYLNRFHLFAKDQVYIFGYPDAGNSSEVGLKVVKLTDFFIHVIPTTDTTTTTPPIVDPNYGSISIIIFIVAVSVLVVLIVCTIVMKMFLYEKSADVDVQNRDDRNSVSGELDNILQLPTPKDSSDDSAADAGPSNAPTDVGTSGNVSPKSMKSVASTSSKV